VSLVLHSCKLTCPALITRTFTSETFFRNLREIWGCVLVYALLQKLDKATQAKWEKLSSNQELLSDKLSPFGKVDDMKDIEHAMQGNSWQISKSERAVSTNQGKAFSTTAESASCVCCMIFQCPRFVRLSPRARH